MRLIIELTSRLSALFSALEAQSGPWLVEHTSARHGSACSSTAVATNAPPRLRTRCRQGLGCWLSAESENLFNLTSATGLAAVPL